MLVVGSVKVLFHASEKSGKTTTLHDFSKKPLWLVAYLAIFLKQHPSRLPGETPSK